MLSALTMLGAIAWKPEIRGAMVVLLAIAILCGSIYLIVATNTGARLGFVIAFTGLMGWMLIMGITWTIYGIGLKGKEPKWIVSESVSGELANAETERARDLTTWRTLEEGSKVRGDAQAAADEYFRGAGVKEQLFGDAEAGYVVVAGYDVGGKKSLAVKPPCRPQRPSTYDSCWDRVRNRFETLVQIKHPTHYAVIQVQQQKVVEVPLGAKPPEPEADPSKPVVSIVMVRDIGNRRFPPVMVTLFSGVMFAIGAYQLHRRDKLAMAARGVLVTA